MCITLRAKEYKKLVVIVIILVVFYVWHKLTLPNDNALIAKIHYDIGLIDKSMRQYMRNNNNNLPSNDRGISILVDAGIMQMQPKDPWGNVYRYKVNNSRKEYQIFTYGIDNSIGGVGLDSDVYVPGTIDD